MLNEPDLETRKFWREKLGLVAVLSDGKFGYAVDMDWNNIKFKILT